MKIGIITYHNAINYGAVFQSYALSKYISKSGYDVEIINYMCPAVQAQYNFKALKDSYSLLNFFNHNITCLLHTKKKKRFMSFLSRLPLGNTIPSKEFLNGDLYDVIITGSDQVFNPVCNGSDMSFFLDFANNSKKYSYAASMGSIENFKKLKYDPFELLKGFNGISLREDDATTYLSECLNRRCLTVMDPVWLLSKSEWEDLAGEKRILNKPYIFVYNLMDFKYMRDFVVKLSKDTQLPIVVANRTAIGEFQYWGKSRNASNSSPDVFLNLLLNSDYFVTDSFHGTSLAVIMEKRVAIALNRGEHTTNSRFSSIIEKMGLENQIIKDEYDPFDSPIDFNYAKKQIADDLNNSYIYLENIFHMRNI